MQDAPPTSVDDATASVTDPSPPPPAASKLTRDLDRKVVAGVAAGLADYFRVDVTLVRVVAVVLTVASGGFGLLVYLALWAIAPTGPGVPLQRGPGSMSTIVAGGLLLAAMAVAFNGGGDGGVVVALALVGIGIALWRRDEDDPAAAVATAAATPPTTATTGAAATVTTPTSVPIRDQVPDWEAPPPPDREPSWLGGLTVGVALLVSGVLVTLNVAGVTALGLGAVASIALVIVGLGLVVGTWVGRARWLVVPAILLLPLVAAGAAIDGFDLEVDGTGVFGQRDVRIVALDDLEADYDMIAGQLLLDLSDLQFEGTRAVATNVLAGETVITVPDDVSVQVRVQLRGGDVEVLDGPVLSGTDIDQTFTDTVADADAELELDVRGVFGEIRIERAGDDT